MSTLDEALTDIDTFALAEAVGVVRHPAELTESPTTPHPVVDRPQVTIANATSTRRIARCHHCAWEYSNTVKSDVEMQARYHRGQHRAGNTPVTS